MWLCMPVVVALKLLTPCPVMLKLTEPSFWSSALMSACSGTVLDSGPEHACYLHWMGNRAAIYYKVRKPPRWGTNVNEQWVSLHPERAELPAVSSSKGLIAWSCEGSCTYLPSCMQGARAGVYCMMLLLSPCWRMLAGVSPGMSSFLADENNEALEFLWRDVRSPPSALDMGSSGVRCTFTDALGFSGGAFTFLIQFCQGYAKTYLFFCSMVRRYRVAFEFFWCLRNELMFIGAWCIDNRWWKWSEPCHSSTASSNYQKFLRFSVSWTDLPPTEFPRWLAFPPPLRVPLPCIIWLNRMWPT